MSREPHILIACLRRILLPEGELPDLSGVDWPILITLAQDHAVAPMLYAAVKDAVLPWGVLEKLRGLADENTRRSLIFSAELSRIARMLAEQNIEAVSLRGPLLSELLYGDLGLRSSGDLDLLVHREDVLRVRDLFLAHEYKIATPLHWDCDSACLRSRECELSFLSSNGVRVDLHWRVLPSYFPNPFDKLDVPKSLRKAELGGFQPLTLSCEHTLLLLCSHAGKHAFERLAWICDIARILQISPGLDWVAVFDQAKKTRTSRQICVALALAAALLGAPLPVDLHLDPNSIALASQVEQRLRTGTRPPTPASVLVLFCVRLLETARQRIRYLSAHCLVPSEAEYQLLRLPPPLYVLYFAVRPFRVAVRTAQS